jgi:uncharacterized protein YaaN involved in tellurite resistance
MARKDVTGPQQIEHSHNAGSTAPATSQPCRDEARVKQLAASINLSSSLGLLEFGEARRRNVARAVDAALSALMGSDASQAAQNAAAILQGPTPPPTQETGRRRLLFAFGRKGTTRKGQEDPAPLLTPERIEQISVALRIRQAALLKESCILEKLATSLQEDASQLSLLSQAACMRAATSPEYAQQLQARAQQLDLSRIAAEQALAAVTLVWHTDQASASALAAVNNHIVPAWRDAASHMTKDGGRTAQIRMDAQQVAAIQVLASAERGSADAVESARGMLLQAETTTRRRGVSAT